MFYVMGIAEDGRTDGNVCGPYDTTTEASEMAVSGQVPVVPLPWLKDLLEGLGKLERDHIREHQHDCRMHAYHCGRADILRDLVSYMNRAA